MRIKNIQKIREKCIFLSKNSELLLSNTNGQTTFFKEVDTLITLFDYILKNKPFMKEMIPVFTMYQWFFASIRKSKKIFTRIRRTKNESKNKISYLTSQQKKDIGVAVLWGLQAVSLFETRKILKDKFFSRQNFLLDGSSLRKGDLILSYKTEKYLKKAILSRIISYAANSQITHALIVSDEGPKATLLCSSAEKNGLGYKTPAPKPGEVFIVLRPKKSLINTESLNPAIKKWFKNSKVEEYKFAEFKSWVAILIGFIYLFSMYLTQRAITLPNPVKNRSTVFCSELIDNIFKEIGVYLTPRSSQASVVAPIEFFYSPCFDLKGVIVQSEDKESMRNEISKKYKI